jgi:hypothetical protein
MVLLFGNFMYICQVNKVDVYHLDYKFIKYKYNGECYRRRCS